MKKIIILGSALLFSAGSLFAQNATVMTGKDARIGIKAGVNLSSIKYSGNGADFINDNTKQNVGYHFGVYGDFGVGNNFFIQPGVSLQNKGTKIEGSTGTNGNTTTGTIKTDIMVVEIPVNAVFRIPTGTSGALLINAGPYIGFNIDGKTKTTVSNTGAGTSATSTSEDLKFGNTANDDVSSTDFGANVGLGYRLNNGFTVGANYGHGFGNLLPKDTRGDNKAENRVWGFSLGYSF